MGISNKIDLFKELKDRDYRATTKPILISTEAARHLTIEGCGAPGGDQFTRKIGALYSVAYTIKMTRKFAGQQDYVMGKLEAQWWGASENEDFSCLPAEEWHWRILIRTPDFVSGHELEKAVSTLVAKGKDPEVKEVCLQSVAEGECVQMLHVGPYDRENETVTQMKAYAEQEGYHFSGRHHEIYLSDPRRVPPERLKTILRIPVKRS